jgi:hypothetical protein
MKKVGPILLLIATLAITAVMYFVHAQNSRKYAFGWGWTAVDIFLALPLIFVIAAVVWLLRAPKGDKQTADLQTPMILNSAQVYPRDIERGMKAGAQAYVTKPSDPEQLLDAISLLIKPDARLALHAR